MTVSKKVQFLSIFVFVMASLSLAVLGDTSEVTPKDKQALKAESKALCRDFKYKKDLAVFCVLDDGTQDIYRVEYQKGTEIIPATQWPKDTKMTQDKVPIKELQLSLLKKGTTDFIPESIIRIWPADGARNTFINSEMSWKNLAFRLPDQKNSDEAFFQSALAVCFKSEQQRIAQENPDKSALINKIRRRLAITEVAKTPLVAGDNLPNTQ